MTRIPSAPLVLGLAGLIPFVWGALTLLLPSLATWSQTHLGARFAGSFLLLSYGVVILCFMSGVLWGFATKADGPRAALCYALSVIPALWAFFATGQGATSDSVSLIAGFVAVLLIDDRFSRWDLTPEWWMPLRILLTSVVALCLGASII